MLESRRRGPPATVSCWSVSAPDEPCSSDVYIEIDAVLEPGPVPMPGKFGAPTHPPIVLPVAGRYEIHGTQRPDGEWDTRVTLHDDRQN